MHRNPTATSRKPLSAVDAVLVAASVLFVAALTFGGLPGGGSPAPGGQPAEVAPLPTLP